MKTIIFVLLKIAEILGAALAYGLLCWGGKYLGALEFLDFPERYILHPIHFLFLIWVLALAWICCYIIYALIKYAIPEWLDINWEWAENITDKIKRK